MSHEEYKAVLTAHQFTITNNHAICHSMQQSHFTDFTTELVKIAIPLHS